MQPPVIPTWFKQRQGKTEAVGENAWKLSGPNLGEACIAIRSSDNGRWSATLLKAAAGPEIASYGPDIPTPAGAWEVAFELYRRHFIV